MHDDTPLRGKVISQSHPETLQGRRLCVHEYQTDSAGRNADGNVRAGNAGRHFAVYHLSRLCR